MLPLSPDVEHPPECAAAVPSRPASHPATHTSPHPSCLHARRTLARFSRSAKGSWTRHERTRPRQLSRMAGCALTQRPTALACYTPASRANAAGGIPRVRWSGLAWGELVGEALAATLGHRLPCNTAAGMAYQQHVRAALLALILASRAHCCPALRLALPLLCPAAAFEYRREASGELLPLAVERIAPGTPQLQQPGPLQQLVAAAQAAWAAPGHVGWAVLQLRGERFVVSWGQSGKRNRAEQWTGARC